MNAEQEEKELETILSGSLTEKTEMGEVAQHVFQPGAARTNVSNDEAIFLFINKQIFTALNIGELDPTDGFMELKKSVDGWSTEKFVEGISGMANMRSGGMLGGMIKDRLLTPK